MPQPATPLFADERRAGLFERGAGRHGPALEHFRAAMRLDGTDRWNRNDVALSLMALGQTAEAEDEALALVEAAPDFAPGHRTLALLARGRDDRAAALGHFRAALACDGRDLWNRHDAAVELKSLGRLDEAREAYAAVAAGTPLAHATRGLGFIARAEGDHEAALECFRTASRFAPEDPWFRLDVAAELVALGRLDAADALCAEIAAAHPAFVPAWRERSGLALRRGDGETACRHLEAAIALAPGDVGLGRELADLLNGLGRHGEAAKLYARLLVMRPGLFEAYRGLARAARGSGDIEAAIAHGRAAVAARPGDAALLTDLAVDLLALGRPEEAEAAARAALAVAPPHDRARRALALAVKAAGRLAEALAIGWDRWRESPDNAAAGFDLAADLREAGRWDLARRIYETLSERPGSEAAALLELAACARRIDGPSGARAILQRVREANPTHPRALLLLADDRREAGRLGEADALYDEALAADPRFYWAIVGKALVARGGNDPAGARGFWTRAIEAHPLEGHAQIELAADLRDAGDPDAARRALASIPPSSPRAMQAAMAEGFIRRASGDWAGAANAFAEVVRRWPHSVEAKVEAAEDASRAGQGDRASRFLDEAIAVAPGHPALLEALARRALVRDDLAEALRLLEKARNSDPTRLWPHLAIARLTAVTGAAHTGMALFDVAEARFGTRAEITLARADMERQLGDLAGARQRLTTARAALPHHPMLWYQATAAEIEAGRFDAAEAALALAPARTLPELGRVRFARSLLAQARWDFSGAIGDGEAAAAALPADGWIRNRLIHASLLSLDLPRTETHLARLAEQEAAANALRGKSANPSQSHYGQLFDEFRLDREALAALQAALAHRADERPSRLGEVVRIYPDSTAAAILFFIELRRAGDLARPAPNFEHAAVPLHPAIPRHIHQYWDDPDVPADVARLMATWKDAHPGFTHHVWDDRSARAFLRGAGATEVLAAYERAREPAMKADLFRLALLHEEGGVYADADDRCLASLEPLLAGGADMVAYQEDLGSLGNNVLAVRPRHPVIARAMALASEAVNRGDSDILWLSTGPGLLTRATAQAMASGMDTGRLHILDRHELTAFVAIHCLTAYKSTERHWSRTAFGRIREARPANAKAAGPRRDVAA